MLNFAPPPLIATILITPRPLAAEDTELALDVDDLLDDTLEKVLLKLVWLATCELREDELKDETLEERLEDELAALDELPHPLPLNSIAVPVRLIPKPADGIVSDVPSEYWTSNGVQLKL